MKWNWGLGIALFYGSFMAILLFFVIRSTHYVHSLVMDNYYEQDLNYQAHYQKVANANAAAETLAIEYRAEENLLRLAFASQTHSPTGTVVFFRPSDAEQDFTQTLALNADQKMDIPTQNLARGRWKVKVDWAQEGREYYREMEIFL